MHERETYLDEKSRHANLESIERQKKIKKMEFYILKRI